ncbi:MAG: ABC transporter permease [Halodesulfurarchaeum sp.]
MSDNTTETDDEPLTTRISRNPRPAAIWAAGMALLVLVEFGAVLHVAFQLTNVVLKAIPGVASVGIVTTLVHATGEIPTLLSRELIPNMGYWNGEQWVGTFLALRPRYAWAIRVALTFLYGFVFLWWAWYGYNVFRDHYRYADWTPRDDQIDRFSRHSWGKFGLAMVFLFFMMAIFAPTLSPTTLSQNIMHPYSHTIHYWSEQANAVKEILVGRANLATSSRGGDQNIGLMTTDQFGRFHPFGTLPTGKDLFTFMMFGARISLFIGLASIVISGGIAAVLALVTAYYKGLVDLVVVVAGDSTQALPVLMLAILISVLFQNHPIANILHGAVLLVLLFGIVYWPFLWRSVRGPAFQVVEEDWVDAAKSFGQRPSVIMEKHMLPYILGYLLIYGSMSIGGIIVSVAGLSYLGIGITPPTPSWGRAISAGQPYVTSPSWHIAFIPGVLITLVVTGLNAFGDGIRDAIDPQSEGGTAQEAGAGGGA